jgi:hypothetical protein
MTNERYAKLAAATDLLTRINRELADDPNFTMTRDQLRARIDRYFDDPDTTDATRAETFTMLESMIRCFRD